jgi:AraC family transcriptional regulator, regulatory protein of adaptative response / methylated-DNA-[protein]-cysteine methyltransferase
VAADDYRLVESAIAYLSEHFREQPDLSEVAAAVGLSDFHFQRLFRAWAGISPKRFVQFLTLEYAKSVLAGSRNLLDASYDAGLSGPGRLHDLFVTLEAVTPGEYRSGGRGLAIGYGVHDSPFGPCLIAATGRGVCGLYFLREGNGSPQSEGGPRERALAELRREWPEATLTEDIVATRPLAERIFAVEATAGGEPLRVIVRGTNFQVQVWQALLRIPSGSVLAYEDVARLIGRPRAVRAVGQAVAHNPVSYLIPCHRVIQKSGAFGNYGGGLMRKRAILAWEAARSQPSPAD